jgi:hypothetical protein
MLAQAAAAQGQLEVMTWTPGHHLKRLPRTQLPPRLSALPHAAAGLQSSACFPCCCRWAAWYVQPAPAGLRLLQRLRLYDQLKTIREGTSTQVASTCANASISASTLQRWLPQSQPCSKTAIVSTSVFCHEG